MSSCFGDKISVHPFSRWFDVSHLFISLDVGKSCGAGFTGRNLAQQMRCSCPTSHLIQNEDLIAGASRSTECASLLHLACPSSSTYKYLASGTFSQLNPIARIFSLQDIPKVDGKSSQFKSFLGDSPVSGDSVHRLSIHYSMLLSHSSSFITASANRWPPSHSNCMVAVLHIAQHLDSSEPHYPPVECFFLSHPKTISPGDRCG